MPDIHRATVRDIFDMQRLFAAAIVNAGHEVRLETKIDHKIASVNWTFVGIEFNTTLSLHPYGLGEQGRAELRIECLTLGHKHRRTDSFTTATKYWVLSEGAERGRFVDTIAKKTVDAPAVLEFILKSLKQTKAAAEAA